jgi:hypothetical protein
MSQKSKLVIFFSAIATVKKSFTPEKRRTQLPQSFCTSTFLLRGHISDFHRVTPDSLVCRL